MVGEMEPMSWGRSVSVRQRGASGVCAFDAIWQEVIEASSRLRSGK